MAPETLLKLCAFLAVSSATLLIYLAVCKAAGRPRTPGGDLADPEHDPVPGPTFRKAPATKPVCAAPAVPGLGGRGSGLGGPIALVAAALLLAGFWQAARVLVRRQFEQVVGKIGTTNPLGIEPDRDALKVPDFRGGVFRGGQLVPDGLRGIRTPADFRGVGAPAPGYRENFSTR